MGRLVEVIDAQYAAAWDILAEAVDALGDGWREGGSGYAGPRETDVSRDRDGRLLLPRRLELLRVSGAFRRRLEDCGRGSAAWAEN